MESVCGHILLLVVFVIVCEIIIVLYCFCMANNVCNGFVCPIDRYPSAVNANGPLRSMMS